MRICVSARVQLTYLCIWTFLVCLCRTVWTCKREWPRRPRGCVWEASGLGWHAVWSTGGGRKKDGGGGWGAVDRSQYTKTPDGDKALSATGQCNRCLHSYKINSITKNNFQQLFANTHIRSWLGFTGLYCLLRVLKPICSQQPNNCFSSFDSLNCSYSLGMFC